MSARHLVEIARGRAAKVIPALLIAAAFALTVALRLHQALAPLSFDEYASLFFSQRPLSELWGPWILRETNPPLFYSLLKLWRSVLPETYATLRALPLLVSLAQIALIGWFARRTYGWPAALLCLLLFAFSPSDIYNSAYIRGYGLAKLAVTVSFLGLVAELKGADGSRRGLYAYAAGALVAIYCHTTMLAWPAIATAAALLSGWSGVGGGGRSRLNRRGLLIADAVILVLSSWVLVVAFIQIRRGASDIAWIEPLSLPDYFSSLTLQLFLDSPISSAAMAVLAIVGVTRSWGEPVTRLALFVTSGTVAVFKAADLIHPVVSDFTIHWCATFTTLLAAGSVATRGKDWRIVPPAARVGAGALAVVGMAALGLHELTTNVALPRPQDWRYTVRTVALTPGAALLVSHESIGVIVRQACRLEFRRPACPFPLVIMANPARTDSWAFGSYPGPIVPPRAVPRVLGAVRTVYAFSRYVYTPLTPLGLDPGDYREVRWDDGELIGPIPAEDFTERG